MVLCVHRIDRVLKYSVLPLFEAIDCHSKKRKRERKRHHKNEAEL
jgi:hypothetical protein